MPSHRGPRQLSEEGKYALIVAKPREDCLDWPLKKRGDGGPEKEVWYMNRTIPVLCCSVAANPSPLGVKLHTAGYEALGLDYRYFAIGAADIEPVLQCVRTLAIRGLGVSMPHKETVIPFLDEVNQDVQAIGACNTVVQENGRLYGHNTDWVGALGAIDEAGSGGLHSAVIIGAGGVARAIAYALKQRGMTVFVSARSADEREKLVNDLGLDGADTLEQQGQFDAELVVNTTPVSDSSSWPTQPGCAPAWQGAA